MAGRCSIEAGCRAREWHGAFRSATAFPRAIRPAVPRILGCRHGFARPTATDHVHSISSNALAGRVLHALINGTVL